MVIARGSGERGCRVMFHGDRVLVLQRGVDGGEGCTTVGMFFMPLSCTLKRG